jgi:hypothetical protein
MQHHNRRHYQRFQINTEIQILAQGQLWRGRLSDLGIGGAGIADCPALPMGEPLKLFIVSSRATGHRICVLRARLVWRRGADAGLRLLDLDPELVAELGEIVANAPPAADLHAISAGSADSSTGSLSAPPRPV